MPTNPGADGAVRTNESARTDASSTTVERLPRSVIVVLAVLVTTSFVMLLNETTLAVALRSIMAEYDVGTGTAQWVLTGFLLVTAIVMPTTGWLLDRFRTRSVFLFAVGAFLAGTIVAALAPWFPVLVTGRVLQAVGTAVVMPLLMTVTMTLVPAGRRGAVMGFIAVVMAVGPALGPTLAGFMLSFTTWHGIFWVMVPLVAASGISGAIWLTDVGERRRTGIDVLSIVLSVIGFGGLVYGLSTIGDLMTAGPGAPASAIALGIGAIGLALFSWRQVRRGRSGRALLDLRPLANRNFTLATLAMVLLFAALLGLVNTLPVYLQGSLLVTALVSGLVLLPGGLLEGVLSPIAGHLFDRFGPRPLVVPGLVLALGALVTLTMIDEQTPLIVIIGLHALFSIALAMLFTPLMTTALGALPTALYGHGSAILNTLQQLAGAAGTAVMLGLLSSVSAVSAANGATDPVATADGMTAALIGSSVAAGLALVAALFLSHTPDRATTRTSVPA